MGQLPARSARPSLPALWAVQRHYGWCTPEGIRQAAAVMGVTPGLPGVGRHLLRPLPHQPGGPPPGARLPQHLLLAARRRRRCSSAFCEAAGVDAARGRPRRRELAGRRGLPEGLRVPGRLRHRADGLDRRALLRAAQRRRRPRPRSSSCAPAPSRCRTRRSPSAAPAGGPEPEPDPQRDRRPEASEEAPADVAETRMLFRHIDEPGLASIETYRRLGGYRALERALQGASSPTSS